MKEKLTQSIYCICFLFKCACNVKDHGAVIHQQWCTKHSANNKMSQWDKHNNCELNQIKRMTRSRTRQCDDCSRRLFVRLVPYIQFQDLLSFFRRAWKQNFIYVTAVARALWRRRKTAEIGKGTLEKRVKSLEQGKKMSCCAVGCKNRHGQSKDIHFHRIPSTKTPFDAERRCLWLQAINRTDWSDDTIRNARICSVHFISGKVFIHCLSHTKAKSMVKSLIINKLISATTKLPFSVG